MLAIKRKLISALFLLQCLTSGIDARDTLRTILQWSQVEFEYENIEQREQEIKNGNFIPNNVGIIDADIYRSPKNPAYPSIFVTMPKFQNGVPVTLGKVTQKKYKGNPIIRPYPSWEWHRNLSDCKKERMVSVFRIQVDECGRLWVLDSGKLGDDLICYPQILAFDLETDQLLFKYEIPLSQIEPRSTLVTPIVDVRGSCRNTFVYAGDCQTYSIIVYDLKKGTSWRITDKRMFPDPDYGTYNILGDEFELMDGILGMSLTTPGLLGRRLFFHAMSSDTETYVNTEDIRNRTRFIQNPQSSPEIFHTYAGRRKSQSAAEAIDKNGIMYFGSMSDVTLNCWDTSTPYGPKYINVLDDNKNSMQFLSGIKIIRSKNSDEDLLVVSSRFQKLATGRLNTNETNFRIMTAPINRNVLWKCSRNFN